MVSSCNTLQFVPNVGIIETTSSFMTSYYTFSELFHNYLSFWTNFKFQPPVTGKAIFVEFISVIFVVSVIAEESAKYIVDELPTHCYFRIMLSYIV